MSNRLFSGPVVVLSCIALAVGLGFAAIHLDDFIFGPKIRSEPADMATVSKRSHVKFPPSAKLKHSLAIRYFIDYELYAEVEIDRKDLEQFIKDLKTEPHATLSRKNRMYIINSARSFRKAISIPEWWNPDSSKNFIAYSGILLISLDNPRKVTVWVHIDTDWSTGR